MNFVLLVFFEDGAMDIDSMLVSFLGFVITMIGCLIGVTYIAYRYKHRTH